jgi:hypothetical protein
MEITTPVRASHIELDIKGGEKCGFIRHYTETVRHGDETRIEHRTEKLKHSKKFLEFKSPVFQIVDGVL